MQSTASILHGLIQVAVQACESANAKDLDEFLERVEAYLSQFEKWKIGIDAEGDAALRNDPDAMQLIQELSNTHTEILRLANLSKDEVVSKLGELRRRAQALRVYIDRLPKRITIAGKREG